VVFEPRVTKQTVIAFIEALKLFKLGFSWGGVTSLVMRYDAPKRVLDGLPQVVRFNVGLEDARDLIDDLAQAFSIIRRRGAKQRRRSGARVKRAAKSRARGRAENN